MAIGSGEITKREGLLVFLTVAFLGLIAVYWFLPYETRKMELADLQGRVEVLERTNQRARADIASGGVAELKAEAVEYGEMFEVLRELVPQNHEVPTLLKQVSDAARREGLELGGIQPEPIIEGPEFDTYRYRISLVGGYHSIARFLTNVGSLNRVVTSVNLSLADKTPANGNFTQTNRGNAATVGAEFEIRTYVARTSALSAAGTSGGMQ